MRIRWRGLELPSRLVLDEAVSDGTYGRFVVEPFERGFGTTVGNSLRRVLLSSLEGVAISAVKIEGATHEFSTVPGVLEDVTDIILRVKGIVVRTDNIELKPMTVSRTTAGDVRAGDIVADAGVEIVNPDHLIATLTTGANFRMEMELKRGRGYATADENQGPEQELGVIPVDSIFSPVVRVRYRTEETRVGQRVNYDRLILEVWTRGSVAPDDAVVEAAKILRKHLNPFVTYNELGEAMVTRMLETPVAAPVMDEALAHKLSTPLSDLGLSVRASNCLESGRIGTLGELAQKNEAELLRLRSFGRTTLREVRRKLSEFGLTLGMSFPHYEGHGSEHDSREGAGQPMAVSHE